MENVKEKYEKRKEYLEKIKPALKNILEKDGILILDIQTRPKSYFSLYQKLLKHEMNFERIYDLVALRIIVKDIKDCYATLGVIHKYWRPLPGRIKDYIAFPKPNGYRSLHTTVFCEEGKITEIQIRTPEIHREAEYGICAHWAQKEKISFPFQEKKFEWVKHLNGWQKEVSTPKELFEGLKVDFFKNRIFVFTPKGDSVDLPEGATPVDFAYHVHTDIGNHCVGARVNGKIVPLSTILKNGDVVEILVDKNKNPSRDWLKFAKTNLARSHIKKEIKKGFLKQVTEKISPGQIAKRLFRKKKPKIAPIVIPAKIEKIPKSVIIGGESRISLSFAKCCNPKPGEEIRAYITRDKGASIHKVSCENFKKSKEKWPEKVVEAEWSQH
jgi:GTP pyrophosphokinase